MVSVVIPCWINDTETLTITTRAVESFVGAGEKHPEIELILIDNGSTVGGGWLRSKADIYLRYKENMGYIHAINDGIKIAHGEHIALANNDILVPANWATVTIEILRNALVGTVHPKMHNYEEPFSFGELVAYDGKERWCQNSFVVTTKRFLKDMAQEERESEPYPGLFDENYGIGGGGEDWEFYHRARKLAYTCVTSKTGFQHKHSHSLQKLGDERQKIVDQNNVYFKNKWGKSKEELFTELYPEQMALDYYEELARL